MDNLKNQQNTGNMSHHIDTTRTSAFSAILAALRQQVGDANLQDYTMLDIAFPYGTHNQDGLPVSAILGAMGNKPDNYVDTSSGE